MGLNWHIQYLLCFATPPPQEKNLSVKWEQCTAIMKVRPLKLCMR